MHFDVGFEVLRSSPEMPVVFVRDLKTDSCNELRKKNCTNTAYSTINKHNIHVSDTNAIKIIDKKKRKGDNGCGLGSRCCLGNSTPCFVYTRRSGVHVGSLIAHRRRRLKT